MTLDMDVDSDDGDDGDDDNGQWSAEEVGADDDDDTSGDNEKGGEGVDQVSEPAGCATTTPVADRPEVNSGPSSPQSASEEAMVVVEPVIVVEPVLVEPVMEEPVIVEPALCSGELTPQEPVEGVTTSVVTKLTITYDEETAEALPAPAAEALPGKNSERTSEQLSGTSGSDSVITPRQDFPPGRSKEHDVRVVGNFSHIKAAPIKTAGSRTSSSDNEQKIPRTPIQPMGSQSAVPMGKQRNPPVTVQQQLKQKPLVPVKQQRSSPVTVEWQRSGKTPAITVERQSSSGSSAVKLEQHRAGGTTGPAVIVERQRTGPAVTVTQAVSGSPGEAAGVSGITPDKLKVGGQQLGTTCKICSRTYSARRDFFRHRIHGSKFQ